MKFVAKQSQLNWHSSLYIGYLAQNNEQKIRLV